MGAALADTFIKNGWIEQVTDTRKVILTNQGRSALEAKLSITAKKMYAGFDIWSFLPMFCGFCLGMWANGLVSLFPAATKTWVGLPGS